ncbi:MAG: c-type cytochrome [Caulobacteraceae bacterium]
MTKISKTTLSAFGVALMLAGAAAHAQAPSAADAIKARQDKYKQIGKAAKGIGDELKKPAPSVPTIQAYAKQIDALAPQVQTWFPKGSGPEAGVKTSAKAEIWLNPDEFKRDAISFTGSAHKLDTVAAGGDLNAVKAQFGDLGQTCKTCHQSFRARED